MEGDEVWCWRAGVPQDEPEEKEAVAVKIRCWLALPADKLTLCNLQKSWARWWP